MASVPPSQKFFEPSRARAKNCRVEPSHEPRTPEFFEPSRARAKALFSNEPSRERAEPWLGGSLHVSNIYTFLNVQLYINSF